MKKNQQSCRQDPIFSQLSSDGFFIHRCQLRMFKNLTIGILVLTIKVIEIIVAIMGSETMWSDIKQLVTYGFKKKVALNNEMQSLESKVELVAEL